MEKLCENCKYWSPVDSMPNWGNCYIAGYRNKKAGEGLTGDVLKRCDENCFDFKPTRQLKKNATGHRRRKKRGSPSMHSRGF
jgi:hypothetical protein